MDTPVDTRRSAWLRKHWHLIALPAVGAGATVALVRVAVLASSGVEQTIYGGLFVIPHLETTTVANDSGPLPSARSLGGQTPLYFYHSFAKSEGLLGRTRQYAGSILGGGLNDLLRDGATAGTPGVVYRDAHTVLIRLR